MLEVTLLQQRRSQSIRTVSLHSLSLAHCFATATGEVMRVTSDSAQNGTSIAVARNLGTTGLTIADDAELFVCGYAAEDGADIGSPISFDPVVVSNFLQIFRTSFAVTGSMQATYRRTGDAEDEYSMKALKLHMQEIERAMFFGHKHTENTGQNNERRYTGGILTSITNVIDGSTCQRLVK